MTKLLLIDDKTPEESVDDVTAENRYTVVWMRTKGMFEPFYDFLKWCVDCHRQVEFIVPDADVIMTIKNKSTLMTALSVVELTTRE